MPSTLTNAQIKRATSIAQKAVEALDSASMKQLEDAYKAAAEDIAERIKAYAGGDDNLALQELRSVLAQVEARLNELSQSRNTLFNVSIERSAELGTEPFFPEVKSAAAMRVSDEALRFVRSFVAEDGLQLSDRIWRIDRGARDKVVNAIEQAVIQGHGAGQAAREFLSRGEQVPIDIQDKLDAANVKRIAKQTTDQLLTGTGTPLDNAMRLMRTEINRAHGEAYMMSGADHPDFAGWRFLLSPAHPKPDICDLLSRQNVHGLGKGVYPSREKCPWPAHPNTLSFLQIVFKDEVTDEDRAGKETPTEALAKLSPEQRLGVLGKNKNEVFDKGNLKQGMIRAPWKQVQRRVGTTPFVPPDKPRPRVVKAPKGQPLLDDLIKLGTAKADDLLQQLAGRYEKFQELLLKDLSALRPTSTEAKVRNSGKGAALVRAVSRLFPDDWTVTADQFGPLYAKGTSGRPWLISLPSTVAGRTFQTHGFRFVASGNDGMIAVGSLGSAIHEYAHRLQHAMTRLDDYFQELHQRRTAGDPLKRLRDLFPGVGYASNEVAREDKYTNAYQGKVYSGGNRYLGKHGALEVMTVAFESVLSGNPAKLQALLKDDREMFDLVIGALYNYVP